MQHNIKTCIDNIERLTKTLNSSNDPVTLLQLGINLGRLAELTNIPNDKVLLDCYKMCAKTDCYDSLWQMINKSCLYSAALVREYPFEISLR